MQAVKNTIAFLGMLLLSAPLIAQMREQPEMADVMRSNGKIYVVVVIAAMVFLGIVVYLINLDRRIKKLENTEE